MQADDEDRVAGGAAGTAVTIEQRAVESREGEVDEAGDAHLLRSQARATQFVARGIMPERSGEQAAVLERLAEGEIEKQPVGVAALAAQLLAHGRHVPVGEAERFEVGECPIGLAAGWLDGDRPAHRSDGVGCPADGLERVRQSQPQRPVPRKIGRQ